MSENKPDRRTLRTQHTLIHALLELIDSKHYDQITVMDIVEHANVGRSTFYAHYQSKDDLLMSGFNHMLDHLVEQIEIAPAGELNFDVTPLFAHAAGHFEIYRTLIWGTGFDLLIQDGHAAFSQKIEKRLASLTTTKIPIPILAASISGVLLVLLKWWLDEKMPTSPETMNEYFQTLMMPGVRGVAKIHST